MTGNGYVSDTEPWWMQESREALSRHCKGSMRTPKRTTTLPHGALWGMCRSCLRWQLTRLDGTVRIHDADSPNPPGQASP